MTARTERRLTLLDVMVFVAMAASGIASLRGFTPDGFLTNRALLHPIRYRLVAPLLPCGLVWTLAVLLLRLGPARPPRRYLGRQPGTVACVAAVSVAVAGATALLLVMIASFYTGGADIALTGWFLPHFLEGMSPYMGFGVLVAWTMLAVNKSWRPEPSWIDRMGRIMGLFWVATIPFFAWPSGRLIL
jgi:hypothetical protein